MIKRKHKCSFAKFVSSTTKRTSVHITCECDCGAKMKMRKPNGKPWVKAK